MPPQPLPPSTTILKDRLNLKLLRMNSLYSGSTGRMVMLPRPAVADKLALFHDPNRLSGCQHRKSSMVRFRVRSRYTRPRCGYRLSSHAVHVPDRVHLRRSCSASRLITGTRLSESHVVLIVLFR